MPGTDPVQISDGGMNGIGGTVDFGGGVGKSGSAGGSGMAALSLERAARQRQRQRDLGGGRRPRGRVRGGGNQHLLVRANAAQWKSIREVIEKLDVMPMQVHIEAQVARCSSPAT
jgi:general secretion pathway protein D